MNEDDSEPSDDHIDTGFRLTDFEKGKIDVVTACSLSVDCVGNRVLAFWWGLWWRAKVHAVSRRNETLTVRFDWSGNTHAGYKPRCVHKL